ncbi:MAG: NAD(P)/FAD-dependent oxidoreductase [Candidatus Binatia bacterium]
MIVGAGFGGLYAARALRRARVQITIVDRQNYHLFQPLLYQVATAALSPTEIAYPIRAIVRRQRNARVLFAEVRAVDASASNVVLHDGTIGYDYLILASGARHSYFAHPEWEPFAPGLKDLDDAARIRRRILVAFEAAEREPDEARRRTLLTFVIVGGGPTGVELAGAIAEIACQAMAGDFRSIDPRVTRTIVVEAGSRILPTFSETLAHKAEDMLRRLCVEVRTNAPVTSIEPEAVVVGTERIAAATTLWAAGVAPSPLARSLRVPLDRAGRVLVQADLSIPGHPEVFVVGDLAAFLQPGSLPLPGLAPVAIQEGRHAAANILRACAGRPYAAFRYRDRGTLATIGRAAAVMQLGHLQCSGRLAWFLWLCVHIVWLIGFRNRLLVLFDWAWAYFTYERSARLITGEGDSSLGLHVQDARADRVPGGGTGGAH